MAGKVSWLALNVGDFAAGEWGTVVQRARFYNIKVIPWARLAHGTEGIAVASQRFLTMRVAADLWGTNLILPNYEKEAEVNLPPEHALEARDTSGWDGDTGWSTNGWLANGLNYQEIYNDPVLLQIFPADMNLQPWEIRGATTGCVIHARGLDNGFHRFTYVGATYQTYGGASPMWYDLTGTYSLFPGDGLAGKWANWFPNPHGLLTYKQLDEG